MTKEIPKHVDMAGDTTPPTHPEPTGWNIKGEEVKNPWWWEMIKKKALALLGK